jgi:pyridoxamine 5'-phosphate oxidase
MRKFRRWMAEAERAGAPLADAIALATADARGRPSVRFVLLKDADERGFVFYTNTNSAKGRHLAANPQAAFTVYWDATGKQVRAEGRVVPVSVAEADAYWAERPWASRVASAASAQSRPIASRAQLVVEYRRLAREYRDRDVPRPAHWTGYRIVPRTVEFWIREEPRLHRRELFTRSGRGWRRSILQP